MKKNTSIKHRKFPKIRSKDKVIVISGADKGKIGEIQKVLIKKSRVLIPNIAMVKKHKKKTQNEPGVIIQIPSSIHLSNVMYYCSSCKKGSRITIIRENKKKIRLCSRCQKKLDKL